MGRDDVAQCSGTDCRAGGNVFPTATGAGAAEIYNWGFRNPWRFGFDPQTGFLWIGDVGEITWEEITISTGPGQHHGWPFREGAHGQDVSTCASTTPQSGDCREPAFEYPRAEQPNLSRASVTGGIFSDHCSWPEAWNGRYWFGDFVKGRVWTLTPNANRDGVTGDRTVIVVGASGPVHFFTGPEGAIYYLAAGGGAVYRIRPTQPNDCETPDAGIMDTGFAMDATAATDSGTVPPDSGAVPADSGVTDATQTPDAEESSDSCSCRSTRVNPNETPLVWAGLALLFVAWLRKRATS